MSVFASAYNTAIHEASRTSPAFSNYKRNPESPHNARRGDSQAATQQLEAAALEEWHTRFEKLDNVWANVLENTKAAQARQERYYNRKHRDLNYNVGGNVRAKNRVVSSTAKAT